MRTMLNDIPAGVNFISYSNIYIYIGFLFHHSLKNMQIRFKIYNIL